MFEGRHGPGRPLVVAGGVAANLAIRTALADLAARRGMSFAAPPVALCTDNGAMVAGPASSGCGVANRIRWISRRARVGRLMRPPPRLEPKHDRALPSNWRCLRWGRGLALAVAARRAGADIVVWSRRDGAQGPLEAEIPVSADATVLEFIDALLLVVPAQELKATALRLTPHLAADLPLVICAKGLARPGDSLLDSVLAEILPGRPLAVLSGPTFAAEVARGLPAAVTIASRSAALASRLSQSLGSPGFRPYASTDIVGVQLGGALKNVIAIACGIVAGRGLGENARAGLMTRGLAEMARLGARDGRATGNFAGLAGLGDLALTATSPTSRNFRLGLLLGRPGRWIRRGAKSLASSKAWRPPARGRSCPDGTESETPISAAVAAIIDDDADIDHTIGALLARPFKTEHE